MKEHLVSALIEVNAHRVLLQERGQALVDRQELVALQMQQLRGELLLFIQWNYK